MENTIISNVQNEILFVGSFYKKPDLYIEYGRYIKSTYDLSDKATKFFYDNFETYYKTFSQTIDEMKVNTFMSQESERLKLYRKYGGYKTIKTWITLADTEDFKNYMETVKKFSLLREYDNKGYGVAKIMEHKKFNIMKANDIYRIIRSGADKIGTVIMANEDSIVANKDTSKSIKGWLLTPQMGTHIPFPILNEMFRGMRKGKLICLGFLSNEGKTRLAIFLSAFIAFIYGEKVAFFANETDEDDFKACLLTTIINGKCFQELHGIEISKVEREIVLGKYLDDNGVLLERFTNEWGEFTETEEDYYSRVYNNSQEFRNILKVSEWLESQTEGKIFYKFMKDHSDDAIEFEIRKHNLTHGVSHFIYDTLKGWKDENWAVLKQTATMLSNLMIELKTFMWADIQLTDDSVFTDIFQFSSNNIANAKQMKHVLDHLVLGKRLDKSEYHKYKFIPNEGIGCWGNSKEMDLNLSKIYYGLKIDKNRGGNKDKIPLIEVDLDRNQWIEVGYLKKKNKE